MTREEAIDTIKKLEQFVLLYANFNRYKTYQTAIDLAIEALSEPSIVRCGECKHSERNEANKYFTTCKILDDMPTFVDSFCSYGERREP